MLQLSGNPFIVYGLRNIFWIFGKNQNYLKSLDCLGQTYFFFSLAFSLGKVVASQGFQVIPHAYRFIDMTFGYLFTSLICGPQGPLWSVLQSSAFDVMGLAFWALWFTWYKPVDLHLK